MAPPPQGRPLDPVQQQRYMDQPKVQCSNPDCDCELFEPCMNFHKVSRFVSDSGKDEYLAVQLSACLVCHTVLSLQP